MEMNQKETINEIDDIIITPFEKVLQILGEIREYLITLQTNESEYYVKNLQWVISRLLSSSLYSYDIFQQADIFDNNDKETPDMSHILNYVNEEGNDLASKKKELKSKKAFKNNNERISKDFLIDLTKNNSNFYKNKNKTRKPSIFEVICPQNSEDDSREENSQEIIKNMSNRKITQDLLDENKKNNVADNPIILTQSDKNSDCPPDDYVRERSYSMINKNMLMIPKENYSNINNSSSNSINNSINNSVNNENELEGLKINILTSSPGNSSNSSSNDSNDEEYPKNILKSPLLQGGNYTKNMINGNSLYSPLLGKSYSQTPMLLNKTSIKPGSSKNILRVDSLQSELDIHRILSDKGFSKLDIISKDFDIFNFRKIYGYFHVMPLIGKVLFEHFGLDEMVVKSKLDNFINSISSCYVKEVLYHNAMHGTDVTLTVALFLNNSSIFTTKLHTKKLDILALITSALGHDIGHPGLNNTYLMNSFSEIAVNYNDISILENFHSANLFRIIKERQNNIFEKFSLYDFKTLRKRIISQILATDMTNHVMVLTNIKKQVNFNKAIELDQESKDFFNKQQEFFDFVVHTADIAHNAKKFEFSVQWVELLSNEFWLQGDKEKKNKMTVSFLCDRNDVNIPKSQVTFIKGIILPTFETAVAVFPTLEFFLENAKNNCETWNKLWEEKRRTGFPSELVDEKKKEKKEETGL